MKNLKDLEAQAEQVVKDMQTLIERAEGQYVQNTPEVDRAIDVWQTIKKIVEQEKACAGRLPHFHDASCATECGYYCSEDVGHVDHKAQVPE